MTRLAVAVAIYFALIAGLAIHGLAMPDPNPTSSLSNEITDVSAAQPDCLVINGAGSLSRPRVIDQGDILNAAEAVVIRDGAARLTLDAVALEAGISKASVIYDYKTKQALIKAVIERKVAEHDEKLNAAIERLGPVPNARIRGRIAAAARTMPADMQAVAINLCSALAQDAELRSMMQASLRQEIAAILETSDSPRNALLAFLAVEGLKFLEFLGLQTWPEPERGEILRDIELLVETTPCAPLQEVTAVDQGPTKQKH